MTPPQPAALSVDLPEATRQRLEAVASARGQTTQKLLGQLVERFLTGEERQPPDLQAVTATLRAHAPRLHDRGITALWVFGSVARGNANMASDIDLLAEFDPHVPLSLVSLASLRCELSELLGAKADLIERSALHPAARETALRDAVRVL